MVDEEKMRSVCDSASLRSVVLSCWLDDRKDIGRMKKRMPLIPESSIPEHMKEEKEKETERAPANYG